MFAAGRAPKVPLDPVYIEDVFATNTWTGNDAKQDITNNINLGNTGGGNSVKFNGTSGGFGRTSKPTGAVDTKTITFSVWLYPTQPNVSQMGILWAGPFNIIMGTAGGISIIGYPDAGNPAFYGNLDPAAITFNAWNHLLFSVDTNGADSGAPKRHVYVNDVDKTSSVTWYDNEGGGSGWFTDAAVDFDNAIWNVGQMSIVSQTWVGRMTEMFLDTTYRDLTVEANRRIFYSSAGLPTTTLASLNPLIYLPMNTLGTDPGVNLGTGGNFSTNTGAVTVQAFGPLANVGKGGLVWVKSRTATYSHILSDTIRGTGKHLASDSLAGQTTDADNIRAFNATGYTVGGNASINNPSFNYVGWTFRKQPKFFDIVTYTGNGASGRSIAHNLGSTPGCIIIKSFSNTERWTVYHRSLTGVGYYLDLSETSAETNLANGISSVTSTSFTIGSSDRINSSGQTFIAYIFAHDAGGFGLTGTDSGISCGSFTTSSNQFSVNLGWEPQWVLFKPSSTTGNWKLADTTRGLYATDSNGRNLYPNLSSAEDGNANMLITPTGFVSNYQLPGDATYIYIAIRKPMKVPTDATKVFIPLARSGTNSSYSLTGAGFTPDMVLAKNRTTTLQPVIVDRLRNRRIIKTSESDAEAAASGLLTFDMDGFSADNNSGYFNNAGGSYTFINYLFKRAPGFFDQVCYTGTGSTTTITHNLAAVPELILVKARENARNWTVYSSGTGNGGRLILNNASAFESNSADWNNTSPTSSVFTVGGNYVVNDLNAGMVAFLFASCPGVSKVGSYTGTGADGLQINCGFAAGARFVLIKRTDSTNDWHVFDTARGINASTDPFFKLNVNAAEITTDDIVDTYSAGFAVNAFNGVNANGGTYIFLAIA
jgi:hypothetical protein